MQRQVGVDFSEQTLYSVAELAMPGQKSRAMIDIRAPSVGIFVYIFLLIPIRYPVPIELCRVELDKGVSQPISFRLRNGSYISADSISKSHKIVPFCSRNFEVNGQKTNVKTTKSTPSLLLVARNAPCEPGRGYLSSRRDKYPLPLD